MKLINGKMLCAAIGIGLGLAAVEARATGWPVFDVERTVEFAGQGVQRLLSLISEYQKVDSKEEELKTWKDKRKINPAEQPASATYGYVDAAKPMSMLSQRYLKTSDDADKVEEEIRKRFFAPADIAKMNEAVKRRITLRRSEYLEELAKEVLSLSAGVRQSAMSELAQLSKSSKQDGTKPVQAASNIQQVDLLAQTKKTMIEQKGADIILQAKLLELEAAEMMMKVNPQLIANPDASSK